MCDEQKAAEETRLLVEPATSPPQQPPKLENPTLLQKIEDLFPHPFSPSALSSLPQNGNNDPSSSQLGMGSRLLSAVGLGRDEEDSSTGKGKQRVRAKRRDRIPDIDSDG